MSKYDLKPGERIKISVDLEPEPKAARANTSAPLKPPVFSSSLDDPIFRRQKPQGLRFFDLGRIKNPNRAEESDPEFIDLNFAAPARLATVQNLFFYFLPITAGERREFEQSLLDAEDLAGKREQLKYQTSDFLYVEAQFHRSGEDTATIYPLARPGSRRLIDSSQMVEGENWNAQNRLKVSERLPNLRIRAQGYFEPFDTGDLINYKVTAEPRFESDPVTLDMTSPGQTDVFLVPRLFFEQGFQSATKFLDTPERDENTALSLIANAAFVLMPRFLTDYARFGQDRATTEEEIPLQTINTIAGSRFLETLTATIYTRPASRAVRFYNSTVTINSNPPVQTSTRTATVIELPRWQTEFAQFPAQSTRNRSYLLTQNNLGLFDPSAGFPRAGWLAGVVKQNNQTFYVWTKTDRTTENYPYSTEIRQRSENNNPLNQWNLR